MKALLVLWATTVSALLANVTLSPLDTAFTYASDPALKSRWSDSRDNDGKVSLLMSLKPELVRVRCDWGKNTTLDPDFLSANTAVYFTNNAVRNHGKVGQHVTILTPVQAKRHVLNWWYAKRYTHTTSALNILDGSSEATEFVLILHRDNRRDCAQIGSKISRGLTVVVDAVLRRSEIRFTLVGLERWCGYHSPAREFLERLVRRRHSPYGSSISPNVEFLSLRQYHDRLGSAQFHLETVLPTLKVNKSFPR
ncbi:hypothetical protein CcaverHIS002_0402500 [Cutaneotrichosporon cavernicola]|nr:hypothetical protein CcaverHIS002_0402500 [Cutaneotrichosporon cavernicola]BEI99200.1 hypothetical protein CcaverHIS631_0402430 [Cutaneotrichosporon cavernicola]